MKHGQRIRFGRVELRLEIGAGEYEESTNFTAVARLKNVAENGKRPAEPARFPLRFAARQSDPESHATSLVPYPEPTAQSLNDTLANPSLTTAHPSRGRWVWLVIGFLALLATLIWIVKKS